MAKTVSPGVLALRKVVDDVYADARKAKADLASFLNERWKGMAPIAWGDTLRESEYTTWVYESVCGLSDEQDKTAQQ